MADFAAWFRREDYERIREVMEDSDRLPPSFDEWELLAKSRVAKAKRDGITLKPVMLDPDTFVAFCKARKIRPNGEARAKFAVDRGLAESMHWPERTRFCLLNLLKRALQEGMNGSDVTALAAQVKNLTAGVEALERLLERFLRQKPVSERQLERALKSRGVTHPDIRR
jgi:hypothetical protein